MAPPVPADSAEDTAGFVRHVYADLHDISERLASLELVMARFAALADLYEPVIKRYALMSAMRNMGRGRKRGEDG